MPEQFDVSLILPCYNEAEHFESSVDRIIEILDGTDFSWEILFIDDKSRDETPVLIKNYIAGHRRQHLSGYFHQINRGRGATVAEGIKLSQGKIVGYIDIDLEVLPDYIPRFVQAVENGADVAAGWRIYDFTLRSLPRWIASKGYNFTNLFDGLRRIWQMDWPLMVPAWVGAWFAAKAAVRHFRQESRREDEAFGFVRHL